jgi:hypothetical protein
MPPSLNEPTLERRSRSAFVSAPAPSTDIEVARAGMRMYRALSTVERLLRDGAITPRQAEAADRLRDDSDLGIHGARDAGGSSSTTGWYIAQAQLAAMRRYKAAIRALGPLWRYVVPIVVGLPGAGDISISDLARLLGRNRQEIAGIVKLGLDVLADHYKLA